MATEGGIIETKQIGIPVNLNGHFINTEIKDGAIQLKAVNGSNTEYYKTGLWISEIIDIGDNFKQYEHLVATITQQDNSLEKTYTSSSIDGITFSDWVPLGASNKIMSPKNKFFKVKIEFEVGTTIGTKIIPNTDLTNEYVENVITGEIGYLVLKKDYLFDMSLDATWTDEGSLHRKAITREEWLRIDKLNIKNKQY